MEKKKNTRKTSDRRAEDRRVKNIPVEVERRVTGNRRTQPDRRQ